MFGAPAGTDFRPVRYSWPKSSRLPVPSIQESCPR
jgi:hypothetical protein